MWLLTNGLKSQTPDYIIHHEFGVVTHSLNAEVHFHLAYGLTGRKWKEHKHYKITMALRIYGGRIKFKR